MTASGYAARSLAHHRLGQYEDVREDCDRAIKLEPQNPAAYNHRGMIRSLHEQDTHGFYHRGLAKYRMGDQGERLLSSKSLNVFAKSFTMCHSIKQC